MHINELPDTYPESLRALAPTVLAGEATRRRKSKITAVPTAGSFGGTIFGGSIANSAFTRKCCLHSCNFRFFISLAEFVSQAN